MTTAKQPVWLAEDDDSLRKVMQRALQRADLSVRCFASADALLEAFAEQTPAVVISDIRMPGMDGLALLAQLHHSQPQLPVIITTAHSDLDSAVAAYEGGAFEYLPKPFDLDELQAVVERALKVAAELQPAPHGDDPLPQLGQEIIGEAPAMQEVFRAIGRLSKSNITVLINGESGTGKELVAHALHRHSPRREGKFIALNMAAIPAELIESELFGHEKGAFTGAAARREGRFEQANGGTLFLDEIGDMPQEAQTRLLRVLADGEFFRVGGHTSVKVDVRIIAATHQNLERLVESGSFREDLFHRLNVIRIQLPRLAERRQDIPQLMRYFFQRAAQELGVESKALSPAAEQQLCQLDWPGNVRQLENVCRWLTVMAAGREVLPADLPQDLVAGAAPSGAQGSDTAALNAPLVAQQWPQLLERWASEELAAERPDVAQRAVETAERVLIEAALNATAGRKRDAADKLGWGRNTLTRKLKEYGIH
ncbi:nitrogen regulation protein NR(I) [Gammaproteobacteria bacterium LSUCC0057]|uniref:DNA-binding transcriptional regulator NtrC n=1 Tax=Gammaproteobacteria bacterium LSUCC0057 TaxID=2559237 RepID=A0A4Y8UFR9_9GAMM|nr:nitrogen regulation protein NR(I) [Gammaproteobacteria bacterium LSUCC0057]